MSAFEIALKCAALIMIAIGVITLIYSRAWPHLPTGDAAILACRWVAVMALATAAAAALIIYANIPAQPALAGTMIPSIMAAIALRFLPVRLFIDQ